MLQAIAREAPSQAEHQPTLQLTGPESLSTVDAAAPTVRLHVHLSTGFPHWTVMVLTVEGRLTAWSFTDAPVPTDAAQPDTYVVRMAGARGSEEWPFWLEVEDGTRVRARLAVVMPL